MSEENPRFRESLRLLAESAAGDPPLSGPQLRALAEHRRPRRLLVVPAVALSGLLVGGTAFALSGGFAPGPRPASPVSGALSASPTAPATDGTPSPSDSPAPAPPTTTAGASGSAPASAPAQGVKPSGPLASVLPVPGTAVSCAAARAGETLVRLHSLQITGGLTAGVGTLLYAVPVSCVRGQLAASGAAQWLPVTPNAVVTTTAPLSTGAVPTVSTLEALATGLTRHPDQLFGIGRDSSGRVIRLDQVFQG